MPDALAQGVDSLQDDDSRLGDLLLSEAHPLALLERVDRHLHSTPAIKRQKLRATRIGSARHRGAACAISNPLYRPALGIHGYARWQEQACMEVVSAAEWCALGTARSSDLGGLALLEIPEVLQEQVIVCQPRICTAARGWATHRDRPS